MRVVWPQLDFGLGVCDFFATLAIYLALAFTDQVKDQFRFYLVTNENKENKLYVNGKTLPKEETAKMMTVRWQVKFALGTLISSYYIFLTVFFYANIWFNDVYERTIASTVYWLAVFPLYIAYILYGKFLFVFVCFCVICQKNSTLSDIFFQM